MKKLLITMAVVAIIAFFALGVFAVAEKNDSEVAKAKTNSTEKNMTYGQCVVAGVQVKKSCYSSAKETLSMCKTNSTETKSCSSDYKKEMKQCKSDFKAVKNDCKKIKHNFFETARYAFA